MEEKEFKKLTEDAWKHINLGNHLVKIFLELANDKKESSGVRMQKKVCVFNWEENDYTIAIHRGDILNVREKSKKKRKRS